MLICAIQAKMIPRTKTCEHSYLNNIIGKILGKDTIAYRLRTRQEDDSYQLPRVTMLI